MLSNLKSIAENKEYLKSIIGVRGKLINWKNSVDKKLECEYDGFGEHFKGVLKMYKYENGKVYFEGYEKGIKTDDLIRCQLGSVLGFKSSEYKYEIGTTVDYLIIIGKAKDKEGKRGKYYNYRCNKCGNENWISEYSLKRGQRCNVCSGKSVALGINSIWDNARWMVDLGISEEDAKTHTPCSNEVVYAKCPVCKRIKKVILNNVYKSHSIGCSCGDGVSYPEKLTENLLIQLNLEYERQYKIGKFRYDFYLSKYNTIIEVHGEQHGQFIKNGELTLVKRTKGFSKRDEIKNDSDKCWVAYKNGVIKHYISIDCSTSELGYVRLNMLNSELNTLLDLNKVNWIKCGEYASSNLLKEVCNYKKDNPETSTRDLVKKFGLSDTTITRYLNKGNELGWCVYDGNKEQNRGRKLGGKSSGKPVQQYSLKGTLINVYSSMEEAEKQTGVSFKSISNCCRGKQKTAGGYCWKYVDK